MRYNEDISANRDGLSVVCVDDEATSAQAVHVCLRDIAQVAVFTDPEKCLASLREKPADIVITDLRMPRIDGLGVLEDVKKNHPATDVIILTGDADKESAIQALRFGAFDFLEKPVNRDELVETIKRTVRYRTALTERDSFAQQVSFLSSREAQRWGIGAFVGKSDGIRKVLDDIRSLQKVDRTSVLITGESGTGKELVARAIHSGSARSTRPFVAVNCSAIPDTLAESLLFGHMRGSFTGAATDKKGSFDLAHGGVLFLDEIGDMLPVIQAKLLRVLEDSTVCPVGAMSGHKVDVRIISATNADLDRKLAEGAFRTDLYHRLAAYRMALPPLREHSEDIPLLATHFADLLSSEMGFPSPSFNAEALAILKLHRFPGNVRELKNTIERALIKSMKAEIRPEHISLDIARITGGAMPVELAAHPASSMPLNLCELEALATKLAMERTGGNVTAAARLLGVSRTRLYRKLSKP